MSIRPRRARAAAWVLGLALASPAPGPALAYVPETGRILAAVVRANREAGRGTPLTLEVSVRLGPEGSPLRGRLLSHPSGLARLELLREDGTIERHLLQGARHAASRDGAPLRDAPPLVPPFFLLQAASQRTLSAELRSFGVDVERAALGYVSSHDCYVIGGRTLPASSPGRGAQPSLWADLESFAVVRVDRADSVSFRFGPTKKWGGAELPAFVEVWQRGALAARIELLSAEPARLAEGDFAWSWLGTP